MALITSALKVLWIFRVLAVLVMGCLLWPPKTSWLNFLIIIALAVFIDVTAYIDGTNKNKPS